MSELIFECPSCGQPIQCEKAYSGHTIHCPNCCADLRIPFTYAAGAFSMPRAELVSEPAAKSAAAPEESRPKEIHCLCPVCRSELKIQTASHSGATPQTAQLVRAAPQTLDAAVPEAKPDLPEKAPPVSSAEREEQIAAARDANPVSLYPPMKPRLDYILSGGEAPHPKSEDEAHKGGAQSHAE